MTQHFLNAHITMVTPSALNTHARWKILAMPTRYHCLPPLALTQLKHSIVFATPVRSATVPRGHSKVPLQYCLPIPPSFPFDPFCFRKLFEMLQNLWVFSLFKGCKGRAVVALMEWPPGEEWTFLRSVSIT